MTYFIEYNQFVAARTIPRKQKSLIHMFVLIQMLSRISYLWASVPCWTYKTELKLATLYDNQKT